MKNKIPRDIFEYFEDTVMGLSAASCLVVLDPNSNLNLKEQYNDLMGKSWKVYHYFGNDLSFRQEFSKIPPDLSFILWVTKDPKSNIIDLSYIPDILEKADKILDFSTEGILKTIIPSETWPENVFNYEKEVVNNLDNFYKAYTELRKIITPPIPLNKNHVKAIVLQLRNQNLKIEDIIFDDLDPLILLSQYLKTAWFKGLSDKDIGLLKEIVLESKADLSSIRSLILEKPKEIATLFYCYHVLFQNGIKNPVPLLRSLVFFIIDWEAIEAKIQEIYLKIKSDKLLLKRFHKAAEDELGEGDVDELIKVLQIESKDILFKAIMNAYSPLLTFRLVVQLLNMLGKEDKFDKSFINWADNLSNHPIIQNGELTNRYAYAAKETLYLLKELAFISRTISLPFKCKSDIAELIDWYIESRVYRLSLALAKAAHHLKVVDDPNLKERIFSKLGNLKKTSLIFLEKLDLNLADLIEAEVKAYFSHPRIITQIIRDMVLRKRLFPTDNRRLWILIFDGMRLDTWNEIVRPIISSEFEILEEKVYLSALPSVTDISRISLLAGRLPPFWKAYDDRPTSDHNILASRLFGLSKEEGKKKLRIVVRSETDYGQRKLDFELKPYNVLIYNLSDDLIHSFRDDVWELNQTIKGKLERGILPDLEGRIKEEDFIIITSDHGFIELEKGEGVKVESSNQNLISHRHLRNLDFSEGLRIDYDRANYFTVAKGRKWFSRERERFHRYSHGGISLEEMLVPGVALKKSMQPIIKIKLVLPAEPIKINENEWAIIKIGIENTGNREGRFNLLMKLDSREEKIEKILKPKESIEHKMRFMAHENIRRLFLYLTYKDHTGKEINETKRLEINVIKRKDLVKMDTKALERLDRI